MKGIFKLHIINFICTSEASLVSSNLTNGGKCGTDQQNDLIMASRFCKICLMEVVPTGLSGIKYGNTCHNFPSVCLYGNIIIHICLLCYIKADWSIVITWPSNVCDLWFCGILCMQLCNIIYKRLCCIFIGCWELIHLALQYYIQ